MGNLFYTQVVIAITNTKEQSMAIKKTVYIKDGIEYTEYVKGGIKHTEYVKDGVKYTTSEAQPKPVTALKTQRI